jgi:hypothetical protein
MNYLKAYEKGISRLDGVIGRRGIEIQLPPSGLAK